MQCPYWNSVLWYRSDLLRFTCAFIGFFNSTKTTIKAVFLHRGSSWKMCSSDAQTKCLDPSLGPRGMFRVKTVLHGDTGLGGLSLSSRLQNCYLYRPWSSYTKPLSDRNWFSHDHHSGVRDDKLGHCHFSTQRLTDYQGSALGVEGTKPHADGWSMTKLLWTHVW